MDAMSADETLKCFTSVIKNSLSSRCLTLNADFSVKMVSQNLLGESKALVNGYVAKEFKIICLTVGCWVFFYQVSGY
jgi:hypothetical protein